MAPLATARSLASMDGATTTARRLILLAIALALLTGGPAVAGNTPRTDIAPKVFTPSLLNQPDRMERSGQFEIRYQPVICILAPCPKGRYTIRFRGQVIAVVRTLVVSPPGRPTRPAVSYTGRCLPFLAVEGRLRLDLGTAFLRPRHVIKSAEKC